MATTKKKAPARRSTIKKSVPASTTHAKTISAPENKADVHPVSSTNRSSLALKIKKSYIIAGLGILLVAALLYALRSWFIVATVNNQPISRLSYIQELERQAGKQTMNAIVTKTLIFQEAEKQNVSVSDNEVNSELKKIEDNLKKQGQRLDQVLTLQGMSKDQLVEQIRIQKLIEKMVGKNIKISDKEVTDYVEANRESLPQDTKEEDLQKSARERLQQQKLNEEVQSWLEKLQKDAKINYFITT